MNAATRTYGILKTIRLCLNIFVNTARVGWSLAENKAVALMWAFVTLSDVFCHQFIYRYYVSLQDNGPMHLTGKSLCTAHRRGRWAHGKDAIGSSGAATQALAFTGPVFHHLPWWPIHSRRGSATSHFSWPQKWTYCLDSTSVRHDRYEWMHPYTEKKILIYKVDPYVIALKGMTNTNCLWLMSRCARCMHESLYKACVCFTQQDWNMHRIWHRK